MDTLDFAAKTIGIVGGTLGAFAFCWRVWDAFASYLHVELAVEVVDSGFALLKTGVENKGLTAKKIDYAVLLIGPEVESPVDTFNQLAPIANVPLIGFTDEIGTRQIAAMTRDGHGRAIIPLGFYFEENVDIADEKVGYTAVIAAQDFPPLSPLAVRFFIFGKGRLHRSTQSAFVFAAQNMPSQSLQQTGVALTVSVTS